MNASKTVGLAVMAMLLAAGAAKAQIIKIETVHVGNAGNVAATTGYGSVSYEYNIGKYEVTAGQYCAFLNAVAKTDINGLYYPSMSRTDDGSGITQSGLSGSFSYTVDPNFANRPVNYVSFWDACRFANWLNNGQPSGAQGPGTTETGTYKLNGYNGDDGRTIQRKPGSTWAVTSDNEWYKAAYYKGGGTNAGYWLYPTRSGTAPGNDMADASGNNANYWTGSGPYPIDNGKYTTLVGEFQNSPSPYGTFDQGGNVYEWNEGIPYQDSYGAARCLRGGAFNSYHDYLQSYSSNNFFPTGKFNNVGFRVSQVPEPATLAVLALGGIGMLMKRRCLRR